MDVNRDEVRRQLREIDHESTRELPRFRESLKRIFDHDSGVSDEAKAGKPYGRIPWKLGLLELRTSELRDDE